MLASPVIDFQHIISLIIFLFALIMLFNRIQLVRSHHHHVNTRKLSSYPTQEGGILVTALLCPCERFPNVMV